MTVYTVDEDGQIFVTPEELDDFDYYRDNVFVRTYEEFLNLNPHEVIKNWEIVADDQGFEGGTLAAVIDDSGYAHILYRGYAAGSQCMRYVTNKTGSWVIETIENISSDISPSLGITIDDSGYIHVFYKKFIGSSNNHLIYATNATGSWVPTDVNSDVDTTQGTQGSIIIDGSGYIHIFTPATISAVRVLRHTDNASGWRTEVIVNPDYSSFTVNAKMKTGGDFVVVYNESYQSGIGNFGLRVAVGTWGSWSDESTGFGTYGRSEVQLDDSDYIHIFSLKNAGPTNRLLMEVTNVTSSWVETQRYDMTDLEYPQMGACWKDTSGYYHIYCYKSKTNWYITNKSGGWVRYEALMHEDESGGIEAAYNGIYYNGSRAYLFYRGTFTDPAIEVVWINA